MKFEFYCMPSFRNLHCPEQIISPEMRRRFTIHISLPSFVIIYLGKYSQLFFG